MSVYHYVNGNETNSVYQALEKENRDRQYGFLESVVRSSISFNKPYLTHDIVRGLNYHAIVHLYNTAGKFRKRAVGVNGYLPPPAHEVEYEMGVFLHSLRLLWNELPPINLGAYTLWQINRIHPFENGNGRTARAACHYVLCIKAGAWLGGKVILPELIRRNREEYIEALKHADIGNMDPLLSLVQFWLIKQLSSQS